MADADVLGKSADLLPGWGSSGRASAPRTKHDRRSRLQGASTTAAAAASAPVAGRSAASDDGWTIVGKQRVKAHTSSAGSTSTASPRSDAPATQAILAVRPSSACCPTDGTAGLGRDDIEAPCAAQQSAAPKRRVCARRTSCRLACDRSEHWARRCAALLGRAQAEVAADGMVAVLASTLRGTWTEPLSRLVVLGLGSPTASAPARYQLALALQLGCAMAIESTSEGLHAVRPVLPVRLAT